MANETSTPVPTTPPVPTTSNKDSIVNKVQKTLDLLKEKNARLADENRRLKSLVVDIKSAHSRIRRIPKRAAAEEPVSA